MRAVARHRLLLSTTGATEPVIRLGAVLARLVEPARLRIGKRVELRDIGLDVEQWGRIDTMVAGVVSHVFALRCVALTAALVVSSPQPGWCQQMGRAAGPPLAVAGRPCAVVLTCAQRDRRVWATADGRSAGGSGSGGLAHCWAFLRRDGTLYY